VNSNLLFTDATYDIGASGATRPRDLFLSRNLTVGGTLTLAGGVNLNGNVTVGDSSADTLTINSTITSNLIFTDNTYDIGASGATRPRSLFLAGNITAAGNQTLTGALTVDSTTDSSSTTTGSIQTDGGLGVAKALFVGTTANIAGAVTLSGGTANGVTYLNGSKVLTSGSALTFDGQTLQNSRTDPVLILNDSATSNTALRMLSSGGIVYVQSGISGGAFAPLAFTNNGGSSELMRLTSTGLGIATTSLVSRLTVKASGGTYTSGSLALVGASSGTSYITNAGGILYVSNDGSTDQLVLNATGNLGIGTGSPSSLLSGSNTNLTIEGTNGGDIAFKRSGGAARLAVGVTSGDVGYVWMTTNTSILFGTNATERARIASTGEVLVNATSSTASTGQTAKLQVAGGIRATSGFTSSISLGTIAQNATTTAAVGFNGVWLISNGGEAFALFNVVLSGGGIKTQLIFSSGSDIVCGTTSEPSGGTYLRLWISGGVLQVKNVNVYTGPYFLTPLATFGS
jgi:hypothetical protein